MSTIAAKDVIFVYNGNDQDTEFDAEGDFPCPVMRSTFPRWGAWMRCRRG